MSLTRRELVTGLALGGLGGAAGGAGASPAVESHQGGRAASLPVLVSSTNGYAYLETARAQLLGGADTLDAAIGVLRGVSR
jgi:hypothetical protein